MTVKMAEKSAFIMKETGETPLECIERFRAGKLAFSATEKDIQYWKSVPMTYAGRLDPLASGTLLVLWDDECKNKEIYLELDKEYEVEVLFGVKTDSGDMLGLIEKVDIQDVNLHKIDIAPILKKQIGVFKQHYPAYSSKTVNGVQLHNLARMEELPLEMPTKEVEIYSINMVNNDKFTVSGLQMAEKAIDSVSKVHGDFRQEEIIEGWESFSKMYGSNNFQIIKIHVTCSSGTYMRLLTERIATDVGTVGMAISITRLKINGF